MAVPFFNYEAALIACAHGDQHAFQDLYQHEAPRMLALSLKMLNERASAEDLVRDAFDLIWKNAESFDPSVSTARAWMHSILRYRALMRLRQAARPRNGQAAWADAPPSIPASTDTSRTSLLHALAGLDATQRQAILLAFYNGYHYEQIAERLDTDAVTLKMQVQAGLNQIAEQQRV